MSGSEVSLCRSGPWQAIARRAVPWATLHAELAGDVLEIGAGGGAMSAELARVFPHIRLTTTDTDASMVDAARTRLAACPNVTVRQADVTRLPFADASFDVVASFLMLHHVIDWESAVAEAARVLRPGGLLVGYDLTDTPVASLIHGLDRSPHRLIRIGALERVARTAGLEPERPEHVRYSMRNHIVRFALRKA